MKILYSTKYLNLVEENGWFWAHRANCKNIAIIIPCIKGKEILFLRTKRPPLASSGYTGYNIELPAGLSGDIIEEDIFETAKRELFEETGLIASKIKLLSKKVTSSAGLTDENSAIFLAYIDDDVIQKEPTDDNGVIKDRIRVEIKDIPSWIREEEKNGNTIGAQTLSALFLFLCDNK